MNLNFLDFEQPIADNLAKIEELRLAADTNDGSMNISEELARLDVKIKEDTQKIFSKLSPWQVVQLARHPQRPYTEDYIERVFTNFDELSGDRHFSAAPAIIGGTARLDGQPVMVIGHQKGRKTKEKVHRNFGMPRPEGYRKALRLMKLAEKFNLPVFTFIDTAGAYPGIGAEERNQSEAIARNLYEMIELKTPIITTVIGEGGSGGALALAVADKLLMLQYSVYATISPEGCASILWKSADKASDAAQAMGMTAPRLKELGIIDEILPEPIGGAHRDIPLMAATIKQHLKGVLAELSALSTEDLLAARYQKYMAIGKPTN